MAFHHPRGQYVIERWDRVFRALTAEPRRQLIVALNDTPPSQQVSLPDGAMSPMGSSERERTVLELQHNHLPLLEQEGFIEWTPEPFKASRGPNFAEIAVIFDALYDNVEAIPDELVSGCQRLEAEREASDD